MLYSVFSAHADGDVPPALPHVSSFFLSLAIMPAVRNYALNVKFFDVLKPYSYYLCSRIKDKAFIFSLDAFFS